MVYSTSYHYIVYSPNVRAASLAGSSSVPMLPFNIMSYKPVEEKVTIRKTSFMSFICPIVYYVVLFLTPNFAHCYEFL